MDEYFPIIDENINPCRGCPDYDEDGCKSNGGCGRPQTNADRIRSMTDEKLAKYLAWLEDPQSCYVWELYGNTENISGWLDWLKQECET